LQAVQVHDLREFQRRLALGRTRNGALVEAIGASHVIPHRATEVVQAPARHFSLIPQAIPLPYNAEPASELHYSWYISTYTKHIQSLLSTPNLLYIFAIFQTIAMSSASDDQLVKVSTEGISTPKSLARSLVLIEISSCHRACSNILPSPLFQPRIYRLLLRPSTLKNPLQRQHCGRRRRGSRHFRQSDATRAL
jgi:hypothetical protein